MKDFERSIKIILYIHTHKKKKKKKKKVIIYKENDFGFISEIKDLSFQYPK